LEAQINKHRPTYIKAKENSTHHQKKLDLAKKTLLAAEKTHAAHDDEIEKYENDLHEVERLKKKNMKINYKMNHKVVVEIYHLKKIK